MAQRRKAKPHRWLSVVTAIVVITLLAAAAVVLVPLPEPRVAVPSVVYDAKGNVITRLYVENRKPVSLQEIPEHLQKAVLAIEDYRFYRHRGIDPIAIARAMIKNLSAGRVVEGGSTITQQLAKNLFLTPERTFRRKVYEALLTIKLEMKYSKQEILEMYLNQIYLGHGSYGVEVAAEQYFGKKASQLSLGESAMLAGLIRSPNTYSPYRNKQLAIERRAVVLDRMVELGYITAEQAEKAKAEPLNLAGLKPAGREAAYFVDYVTQLLEQRHPELSPDELYRGGYRIYTALDMKMQLAAQRAFIEGLEPGKPDEKGIEQPQGALVAVDPRNGYIRAMVGGRDFSKSQYNRAVQAKRQPGSAFKPFLYTAVIASGYTAISKQECQPVSFRGRGGKMYVPKDYGDQPYHYREMGVREAIAISDNVVAVKWAATVGPQLVADYARRLGIQSPLEPSLPLVLGASEVTPLEMAASFAPFANMGLRVKPLALLRVEDPNGRVIEKEEPRLEKVLDEKVAYVVTDLLKSVLRPGGTGAHLAGIINRPAAGKTGTTEGQKDAWFVGYTPDLVAAVYVGNDNPEIPVRGPGGVLAGPIWARFMREALQATPKHDFPRPFGVVEVALSPSVTEVFIKGTEPIELPQPVPQEYRPPPVSPPAPEPEKPRQRPEPGEPPPKEQEPPEPPPAHTQKQQPDSAP